jgi:beta-1,4-mannosyl-glycoprotein beta-1,4-N-acetylglucosaminyltransferase
MLLLRPVGRSRLFALGGIFLFILVLLYVVATNHYQIKNAFSYATRPLWDKAEGPTQIVAHYYAEGMEVDSYMCQLHGWQERSGSENVKVLDAVLMSSELDLLEIRMNELDSVVDRFFVLESNATFTGLEKETYFAKNRERFAKFEEKISYHL